MTAAIRKTLLLLPGLLGACLVPIAARAAIGTVPAYGGTLSGWSVIPTNAMASLANLRSNGLPIFQNTFRQASGGKPIRIGWMGDSVGDLTGAEVVGSLAPFYGRNGAALYGGNYLGFTLNSTTTNVTRLTNWLASYWELGTGGQLTASNFFGIWTWADRLGCEFLNQTNGGTFKLQLQTNGGAFADVVTGISTATASGTPIGNVTNYTMLPGYYAARIIQTAGGIVSILGADLWATNNSGVRVSYLNSAGSTVQDMAAVPTAISTPIMNHLGLDLLFVEGTADPTANAQAAFSNLNVNILNTLATNLTDVVLLGTTPIDPVHAFDVAAYNAAMRAVAEQSGWLWFLDQSIVSGSYADMQRLGTAGDGLHRTNLLSRACAGKVMDLGGIGNTPIDDIGKLLSRGNLWTGTNVYSNSVIVAGSSGQLLIRNQQQALPDGGTIPDDGRLRTVNGSLRIGFNGPFGGADVVQFHSGYGGAGLPITPGNSQAVWGNAALPWTVGSSNGADYGLLTLSNNYALGIQTVTGIGNGNTNFLLGSWQGRQYLQSFSNVNIVAITNAAVDVVYPWTLIVSNRSANTWGFQFPNSSTNRVKWVNGHTGGTNAPAVLTNSHVLRLQGESQHTNTTIWWHMQAM